MGNTCGCADKSDQDQEVRVDPVSLSPLLFALKMSKDASNLTFYSLLDTSFMFRKNLEKRNMDTTEIAGLLGTAKSKPITTHNNSTSTKIHNCQLSKCQQRTRAFNSLMSSCLRTELSTKVGFLQNGIINILPFHCFCCIRRLISL